MTAKEMFDELGYKLMFYHLHPETTEEYQFIYESKDEWNNPTRIEFRKCKNGVFELYISQLEITHNIYDSRLPLSVLQAINKQVKELGWYERKRKQSI